MHLYLSERPGTIPKCCLSLISLPNPSPCPTSVTSETSDIFFLLSPYYQSAYGYFLSWLLWQLFKWSSCPFSVSPLIFSFRTPVTVIFVKNKADHIILCHYLFEIIQCLLIVFRKKVKLHGGSQGSVLAHPEAISS